MARVIGFFIQENLLKGEVRITSILEGWRTFTIYRTPRSRTPHWERGWWAAKELPASPEGCREVIEVLERYCELQDLKKIRFRLQRWEREYESLLRLLEEAIYRREKREVDALFAE